MVTITRKKERKKERKEGRREEGRRKETHLCYHSILDRDDLKE